MVAGRVLRFELLAPGRVHGSVDGWRSTFDLETRDTGLGVWIADLPASDALVAGAAVDFTFQWPDSHRWEGRDFRVSVESGDARSGV
jgi:glucoamylase